MKQKIKKKKRIRGLFSPIFKHEDQLDIHSWIHFGRDQVCGPSLSGDQLCAYGIHLRAISIPNRTSCMVREDACGGGGDLMWPAKFFPLMVVVFEWGISVPGLGVGVFEEPASDPNKSFPSPFKTLPPSYCCMLIRNTIAVATKNILTNFFIITIFFVGNWEAKNITGFCL